MRNNLVNWLLLCAIMCALGCSESIDTTGQDGGNSCIQTRIEVTDGVSSIVVDTSDYASWVTLHLETGITDGETDWDLAIRRYAIRLNGGTSGTGYGIGQSVAGDAFSDTAVAPEEAWSTDLAEADSLIFSTWYDYNPMTHQLSPADKTYFVRSFDGDRYYAVTVDNYYSPPPAGDSGCMTLRWKRIDPPTNEPENIAGTGSLPTDSEQPNMSNDEESDDSSDDGPGVGCYSGPPNHMCDCQLTQEDCDDAAGVWTSQCECDVEE